MTKIDLITGFLGSGKTTFLKQYVHFLLNRGERVAILEFDYGAINVDMMLLQEFNDVCDLEMVAGGCDHDCHLRRFKTKLIAMGMKKYDRVIVEPSGIFDPDEFFDTLAEEPLDSWYEIGSVISVVDVGLSHVLSQESQYILISQLAVSGKILLSKTQNYSSEQIEQAKKYVQAVCGAFHVNFDEKKVMEKPFSEYGEEDYLSVMRASYSDQPHTKMDVIENNAYASLYFMDTHISLEALDNMAKRLFSDSSFGSVIRIKGFVFEQGKWFEFNKTKEENATQQIPLGQDVVIVIGEKLNAKLINSLFSERKK